MASRFGTKKKTSASESRPAGLLDHPMMVFPASANAVFVLGSILLVTISASPASTQAEPPGGDRQTESSDVATGSGTIVEGTPGLSTYHRLSLPPLDLDSKVADGYHSDRRRDPTDFSVDTNTGTLAIVGPWKREIGFVTAEQLSSGATAEEIVKVKLPGRPACVEYKPHAEGGLFLVGYAKPNGMAFIDAASFELVKQIGHDGPPIRFITCAQDPNVAVAYAYERPFGNAFGGRTFRLNTVERSVDVEWRNGLVGLVSHDGKTIYTKKNGPLRPRAEKYYQWSLEGRDHYQDRIDADKYPLYLDPRGRFLTCGVEVYPPQYYHKLSAFEFEASAVSASHPWSAGIGLDEFIIGSINSGKVLRRFKTPNSWRPKKFIATRPGKEVDADKLCHEIHDFGKSWAAMLDCEVFADDGRDRFILAQAGNIYCFPYDDLELPEEPDLWLTSAPPEIGYVGHPLEFEIKTATVDADVELQSNLGDARIEGRTFHWTPQNTGRATFTAKITKGDVCHVATWSVDIKTTPTLDIPFFVMHANVSFDESKLVVFGYSGKPKVLRPTRDSKLVPKVAVVDLNKREIIAQQDVPQGWWGGVVCGDQILIPSMSSRRRAEARRLKTSDLSELNPVRITAGTFYSLADRFVAVDTQNAWYFYSLPELEHVGTETRSTMPRGGQNPRRLVDGWIYQGMLWDRKLKRPKLLQHHTLFANLGSNLRPSLASVEHVYQGYVLDQPATMQHRFDQTTRRDCDVLPANVRLVSDHQAIKVNFSDIPHNKVRHETILETRKSAFDGSSNAPRNVVDWTSKEMFAVWSGKLYVIDLTPIRKKFPRPFHIVPNQSTFVLEGRTSQVSYHAEGATGFTLELPGLATADLMASADGNFVIDVPDPVDLAKRAWELVRIGGQIDAKRMESYAKLVRNRYRGITGREPVGVPIAVDAYVTATGPKLESAVLHHYYLLDIPQSAIEQAMPERLTRPRR